MNWGAIELSGYAYYAAKGYRILAPLVHNNSYDFVAEKDGMFLRVNVKTAGLKDKSDQNSWAISQASGGAPNRSGKAEYGVDVYLVYLPQDMRFIELSGDFLNAGNSKSRRIPKEFLIPT